MPAAIGEQAGDHREEEVADGAPDIAPRAGSGPTAGACAGRQSSEPTTTIATMAAIFAPVSTVWTRLPARTPT